MSKNILILKDYEKAREAINLLRCLYLKIINGESINNSEYYQIIELLIEYDFIELYESDLYNKLYKVNEQSNCNYEMGISLIILAQSIYNNMINRTIFYMASE